MSIQAHPLAWPAGWKRTDGWHRSGGAFRSRSGRLTIIEAVGRVLEELQRMGIKRDDVVISTNVPTRLDGLPRSDQPKPRDPGAAVYWRAGSVTRCMAVDRYTDVAQNLAALAATLEAMRAIERHGGAAILDRAFEGFRALAAPTSDAAAWHEVLNVPPTATRDEIDAAWRRAISAAHPDRGGDAALAARVNKAREDGRAAARS